MVKCEAMLAKSPSCLAFLKAWQKWRNGKPVPTAADIRPEDMGKALASLIVLEIDLPDRAIYRLVGSKHDRLAERSLKGANFFDFITPEERAVMIKRTIDCYMHTCGALTITKIIRESGAETSVRTLWLPIKPATPDERQKAYAALDVDGPGSAAGNDPMLLIPMDGEFYYVDVGCGAPPDNAENIAEEIG